VEGEAEFRGNDSFQKFKKEKEKAGGAIGGVRSHLKVLNDKKINSGPKKVEEKKKSPKNTTM